MRFLRLMGVAAVAVTMAASPAMAACKNYYKITPDTAPVAREKVVFGAGGSLNGTDYTKATFCPEAAAAGTCTGESLSERVGSTFIPYVTYDGNVPNYWYHLYGEYKKIGGDWTFVPYSGNEHSGFC